MAFQEDLRANCTQVYFLHFDTRDVVSHIECADDEAFRLFKGFSPLNVEVSNMRIYDYRIDVTDFVTLRFTPS